MKRRTRRNPVTTIKDFTEDTTIVADATAAYVSTLLPNVIADPDDPERIRWQLGGATSPSMPGTATTWAGVHDKPKIDIRQFAGDAVDKHHAAFAEAISVGGVVNTPSGEWDCEAQLVVPSGLKWNIDDNAVLIKNFQGGGTGNRLDNALIRNEHAPAGALLQANPGGWEPSIFDEDIVITGGRIRHVEGLIGGGIYIMGARRLVLSGIVVERSILDWAFTIGADDCVLTGLRQDNGHEVFEDGIHILWGHHGRIFSPHLNAGDDAIAFGANYNLEIDDWEVHLPTTNSREAHAISLYNYRTGSTAGHPAPTNKVSNIRIYTPTGLAGEVHNGIINGWSGIDYVTGTAQAGTSTSITLAATCAAKDDFYTDCKIRLTGGTGNGQERMITDYNGATKVATVAPAFSPTPNNTTVYSIAGALCENIEIYNGELQGGPIAGHDGASPYGARFRNIKNLTIDGLTIKDSIQDSFYFQDIIGTLKLSNLKGGDPQNNTAYCVQLIDCDNVVMDKDEFTRKGNNIVSIRDSNVISDGVIFNGIDSNCAAWRTTNTAGKTTNLKANGGKYIKRPGAVNTRPLLNAGTGTEGQGVSYTLDGADLTECDLMPSQTEFATPASAIIRNVSPASKQVITGSAHGTSLNRTDPSVRGVTTLLSNNSVDTVIDNFTGGHIGQKFDILAKDTHTILGFSGSNLKGNGGLNWRMPLGARVTCTVLADGIYCEVKPNQVDVQVFTANGTWTKPAGAKSVSVLCIGAGGGGGAGARGPSGTALSGGGGGGGGGLTTGTFAASEVTDTVSVTLGAGGAGAAGQTTNGTAGATGSSGANATTFGGYLLAGRALGGVGGGLATAGTGGAAGGGQSNGSTGGAGSATGAAGAAGVASAVASGGGAGGGITTGATAAAGGAGGSVASAPLTVGTAGAVDTTGGAGSGAGRQGTGGGGGGASVSGAGATGGAGANYGGGGGGGGASLNGSTSGAGGAGGGGLCVVTTYF